jgi:Flp pilus assembly pilin Flp
MLRTLRDDDRGQGLAEYGLILGFVAVLCIGALVFFGSSMLGQYQNVSTQYP